MFGDHGRQRPAADCCQRLPSAGLEVVALPAAPAGRKVGKRPTSDDRLRNRPSDLILASTPAIVGECNRLGNTVLIATRTTRSGA